MSNKKLAIATGANKGLGFAIVKALCEKFDGTVYLTARDEERGRKACKKLEELGLKPIFHQLDVSNKESVSKFRDHIQQAGKVAILVNNAGILYLNDSPETKIEQARETIRINFDSLVNFCEEMIPLMEEDSKIVNISSSSGHLSRIPSKDLRAKISDKELTLEELRELMNKYVNDVREGREVEEGWGESPYVVSKVGVNAYTFMLHRRLYSKGIITNCVHPGYVMSDMTRGGGSITPDDAAKLPVDLALKPQASGLYVWHDGTAVPWDGPDPRGYIDGKN